MPHIFIRDLQPATEVSQFFIVRRFEQRTTNRGRPYWNLLLSDRTGTIPAKVWSDALSQCDPDIRAGSTAGVRGRVEHFQNELQINVKFIGSVEYLHERGSNRLQELDLDLLTQATPYDVDQLWGDLRSLCEDRIQDPNLKHLTCSLLEQHEGLFKQAPAALEYHHAYRGGLLEHTWKVLRYCLTLAEEEPDLDKDLLISGAVLHDIGKILEICGATGFRHSIQGRLLGHVVLGRDLVRDTARQLGMNLEDLKLLHLEHILLSHHGEPEFGSPIPSKSREAYVVHTMDDLNAKLFMITEHARGDKRDDLFTEFHRVLKRSFFIPPLEKERDATEGETDAD